MRACWIRSGVTFLALSCASAYGQEASSGEQHANAPVKLDVRGPQSELWLGEWGAVQFRIEVDASFRETALLQLFRRALDVPLHLQTEAWHQQAALQWQALEAVQQADGLSMAWNGEQLRLPWRLEQRDGQGVWITEWTRRVRAMEPGDYKLAAASLTYATATEFEEDFLGDRIPMDEHRVTVRSSTVEWTVRPFPVDGQPPAFDGAVGEWNIEAEQQPTKTDRSGRLQLVYKLLPASETADAVGVLPSDWRPGTDVDENWQLLGSLRLPSEPGESRVQLDLQARHGGEVWSPRWNVVSFVPDGARYLQVDVPRWKVQASPPKLGATLHSARSFAISLEASQASSAMRELLIGCLLGAALLAVAALLHQSMRRRAARREREPDPMFDRKMGAIIQSGEVDDPQRAFVNWLAEQLQLPVAQLIGPDVASTLKQRGFPGELVDRTVEWISQQEAARYGGPALVNPESRELELRAAWSKALQR